MKTNTRNSRIKGHAILATLVVGLTTAGLAQQESSSETNSSKNNAQQKQPAPQTQKNAGEQRDASNPGSADRQSGQNPQQKDRRKTGSTIPKNGKITDADIAAAVKDDLSFDSAIHEGKIEVKSEGGTLTLSGNVPNLLSKERAEMVAEAVRGVRSVNNRIEVQIGERPDEDIRRDVLEALREDPAADAYEIIVAVQNGVVTLSNSVDSWHEKELANSVASRVKGVREVQNRLEIVPKTERLDSEIAADIKSAFDWDTWIRSDINVEVKDGHVTLSGTVGSAAEKNRARYDAFVTGAKSVEESGIQVNEARKASNTAGNRTPEDIKQAVRDAFIIDPRVNSYNPEIEVGQDGALTLTGTVENLKAKQTAKQIAQNIRGVRSVDNQLQVRTEAGKDDQQLTVDINAALARDPFVDGYEISVTADNGTVTLAGTVDSTFEKQQAGDAVSRINGVTQIMNNLTVQEPTYTYYTWPYTRYSYEPFYSDESGTDWNDSDDVATAESIRSEMFWSPFVDGDQIEVIVSDGVATLNGKVEDWSEYNAAVENAYEGGADRVKANLQVIQ